MTKETEKAHGVRGGKLMLEKGRHELSSESNSRDYELRKRGVRSTSSEEPAS